MRHFLLSGVAHWAMYPVRCVFWLFGVNTLITDACELELSLEKQIKLYEEKYEWRLRTATYLMEQTMSIVLRFVGVPKSQVRGYP